jgi:pyrroloquinoline quinone (PQQ) biosynthesis protein C
MQTATTSSISRPSTGFGKQLEQELQPLYDTLRNHPLVRAVQDGTASWELIRGFTKEFLPLVRGTYRRMAMRLQHAAAHDCELQENLLKEVREEVWHTPMYLKWAKTIKMNVPDDFTRSAYLPETYGFILFLDATSTDRAALEESCIRVFESEHWDDFSNYSQQSSLVQTIASSGMGGRAFPPASDKLADGFRRHYGLTDADVEFWTEHGTLDMEHTDMGLDIVDRYATTPALQARARESATITLELWIRWWDAIYKKYQA